MNTEPLQRCTKCVLPVTFPGIEFDEHGLCSLCFESPSPSDLEEKRASLKIEMSSLFEQKKGEGEFDILVAYSGGKDSSYILGLLSQEYRLRCLAITIDNGFISERAFENGRRVTEALGVDYHIVRPSPAFVKQAFRKSLTEAVHPKLALKRASSVCNTCISMINNHMVKTAIQWDIPMIAGGYISGQVPRDSAVLSYHPGQRQTGRLRTVAEMVRHFGPEAERYYGIQSNVAEKAKQLYILNPMLTLNYSESEIYKTIAQWGWEKPSDTGVNSSNCLLNDLGVAAHVKQHQFNPYVNELAELVRHGLMTREEALSKVDTTPSFSSLKDQMKQLDLSADQI